ncbi:hypothetical protein IMG5_188950, partial [Ichthyophthirius multifiliis]
NQKKYDDLLQSYNKKLAQIRTTPLEERPQNGLYTPSNSKLFTPNNNVLNNDQFSNESFGITPKKIDFLEQEQQIPNTTSHQKIQNSTCIQISKKYENMPSLSSLNNSVFEIDEEKKQEQKTKQQNYNNIEEMEKTILTEDLQIKKLSKNQKLIIEQFYLNQNNIISYMPNQSGKTTLYQIMALISQKNTQFSLLMVITNNTYSHKNINSNVSWAYLNKQIDDENMKTILEYLNEFKIRLLLINWDFVYDEKLYFLKNIVDKIIIEDPKNERQYQQLKKAFPKVTKWAILYTQTVKTQKEMSELAQKCALKQIESPQKSLKAIDFGKIYWIQTQKQEKEKNLFNFLHKNQLKKVILFLPQTEKKQLENTHSYFAQKGLKFQYFQPKNILQQTQQFQKENFDILTVFSGTTLPSKIKEICQYYIHFSLPLNIKDYLSDLNGFQRFFFQENQVFYQKLACGFLVENEFFLQRRNLISSFITENEFLIFQKAS